VERRLLSERDFGEKKLDDDVERRLLRERDFGGKRWTMMWSGDS